jgi:hypothetical protein
MTTPADHYEQIRVRSSVREAAATRALSEMEMQARWFAGEFGRKFRTTDGGEAEIVQFGVWNREAGPDFAEAAVRLGDGGTVRGAIEIDPDARDWEHHGHATNPDYRGVVLHVFWHDGGAHFFTRTDENRNVPQVALGQVAPLVEVPAPEPVAKPGRCVAPLRAQPEGRVREIIEAAAQFRLRRKAARLGRLREIHGADEALYQALAETLGYKANKLPFTLLAQRLPLKLLRKRAAEADALLFGTAGFLGDTDLSRHAQGTRFYLRKVWERWWPARAEFERLALAPRDWRLAGLRPMNHPQRRLAALARMVAAWPRLRKLADGCDARKLTEFFESLRDDFWERHYTLTAREAAKPMALVGQTRVVEMLANVFIPLASLDRPEVWKDYAQLPAALDNRRVNIAALRLFGGDGKGAAFTKTVAHQQGLLQIYEDFCMQDASDCALCQFPQRVEEWR